MLRLLIDADEHLAAARRLPGEERDQVVADAEHLHRQLTAALFRLTGERRSGGVMVGPGDGSGGTAEPDTIEPGVVRLQLSWEPGRVVAWAGGPGCPTADADEVAKFLADAEAPAAPWAAHPDVPIPGGDKAAAVAAPVGEVLGWLVAAGAGEVRDDVGPSVRWLGKVAMWAVELAARGAMVPVLRQRRRRSGSSRSEHASYAVRWTPALVDPDRLAEVVEAMPGSVAALDPSVDARAVTRSALTGMVDAIGRDSARRIEVPAAPPVVRTGNDVTEAFLARLDGSAFDVPVRVAGELVSRAESWSRSVTREHSPLIVRLDPPDRTGVWDLEVFVAKARGGSKGKVLVPVERAIVDDRSKRADLEHELGRLERLLPELMRAGSDRRGHTILSQDEAWQLMTNTGPRLADAGYDVRVPELSTRKATPMLRVFSETKESAVGANQLADVRWSAVFDDVELTAAEIRALAKEARPLIRSGGKWVALDKADLQAAASALAERARHHPAHRRRHAAPRARARGLAPRRWHHRRRWRLGRRSPRRRVGPVRRAGSRPQGVRRRAAQLPGRGAGVAGLPRSRRHRRLPRPRHGPGQDAHHARPPPRGRRPRSRAGDRAHRRSSATGRRRRRASRPASG